LLLAARHYDQPPPRPRRRQTTHSRFSHHPIAPTKIWIAVDRRITLSTVPTFLRFWIIHRD
jgi:hypothetical protein